MEDDARQATFAGQDRAAGPAVQSPAVGETAIGAAPGSAQAALPVPVELATFLLALVGALALGLGITEYLSDHPYVFGYLIAYAGFCVANLLIGQPYDSLADCLRPWPRTWGQLPLLLFFAAPPFERTYIYGGDPPQSLAAAGLVLELAGLWLTLAARIQLGRFARSSEPAAARGFIRSGLYRYLRHPIYAGSLLIVLAWPLQYTAPLTGLATLAGGALLMHRRMEKEESIMIEQLGEQYAAYVRQTARLLPGLY